MNAYTRDISNGTLHRTNLIILDDGEISLGGHYNPVALTVAGSQELKGWGRDDGLATVYTTESGQEVIVPERHSARVKATLPVV